MASQKDLLRHVVTSGNYPMAAPGPLFTKVCKPNGSAILNYNVSPGQAVAWVVKDGQATIVDADTITAEDSYEFHFGVGMMIDGKMDIREIGADKLSGCLIDEFKTVAPKCGSPEVVDFFFDCVKCDETYSLTVKVDDNRSRSFGRWNASAEKFVASYTTECHSCDDCPGDVNCKEVACGLVDALNNDLNLKVKDKRYPDWKGQGLERPFFATRLHERSLIYCLDPKSDDECPCENCNHFDALTQVVVDGVTIDLVGTVDPKDDARTLRHQLDSVAAQIQCAFDEVGGHIGSAFVTGGGYSDCCSLQLHVNTCDTTFDLPELTACVDTNPFVEFKKESNCADCGDEDETYSYNCGIRVISKPLDPNCDCFLEMPLAYYGVKVDIEPMDSESGTWKVGTWDVVKTMEGSLPNNFGNWIQYKEYSQPAGGRARNYRAGNVPRGPFSYPDKKSRVRNAISFADCAKDYCSYVMDHRVPKVSTFSKVADYTCIQSEIHVPYTDPTTKEAIELFWAKINELNPGSCKVLNNMTCEEAKGDSPACCTPEPAPVP